MIHEVGTMLHSSMQQKYRITAANDKRDIAISASRLYKKVPQVSTRQQKSRKRIVPHLAF
jgi:hypothetical protein